MDSKKGPPDSYCQGSWLKNRPKRYDVDDFAFPLSPPVCEEGFLHYPMDAQTHAPKLSMYDRINKELGLIENSHPTLTAESEKLSSGSGISASISLSSASVSIKREEPSSYATKIVVPTSQSDSAILLVPPAAQYDKSASMYSGPCNVEKSDVASLVSKAKGGRPTRKISMNLQDAVGKDVILGAFQTLSVSAFSPVAAQPGSQTSTVPVMNSGESTAMKTRQRKTSAPSGFAPLSHLSEKHRACGTFVPANYFFTGSALSATSSPSPPVVIEEDTTVPSTSLLASAAAVIASDHTEKPALNELPQESLLKREMQLEEAAKAAAEMHTNTKMGKRRPKPSALREMNFFAPQSM